MAIIPALPEMAPPASTGLKPDHSGVFQPVLFPMTTESSIPHQTARYPRCYTVVYTEYCGEGLHVKYVISGTLDRPSEVSPVVHIFIALRRNFVAISDGKPQFDEFYDRKEEWRFGKLGDEIAEWREKSGVLKLLLEHSGKKDDQCR